MPNQIIKSCQSCHGKNGTRIPDCKIQWSNLSRLPVPYNDSLFFRFLDADLKSDGSKAKTGVDRLMVRVGKAAYDDLLDLPGCREMDFTGKPMKGFLFIYPEGFDTDADLDFWMEKALAFNRDGAAASKKRR